MNRRPIVLVASLSLAALAGCQSMARLPGLDPTDYAYTYYLSNATQVYRQTVPQLQSSALEALADLGYTGIHCEPDSGTVTIRAKTVDHRPVKITIKPRNAMSAMTVKIGVGDEMASQALLQRVGLNFGELPRTLVPLEPTLSRRIDPLTPRRPLFPADGFIPSGPERASPPIAPIPPEGLGPFSTTSSKPATASTTRTE